MKEKQNKKTRNQNQPKNESERLSSCNYHVCNVIRTDVIAMNIISSNLNMTCNMNTPFSIQRVF